jgi:predicted nuclease of predicted toxin-antitoxin system
MTPFLADENFPHPSFVLLKKNAIDVIHVGLESPTIDDKAVLQLAIERSRILLTLDTDHGELIYRHRVASPPGIVLFRIPRYRTEDLGHELLRLIALNFNFEGLFTVVGQDTVRQRPL